ncbi:MAG TPA: PPC domain-containing protein [Bryobacteraceae bacterium]|jgi:hypothetical protein
MRGASWLVLFSVCAFGDMLEYVTPRGGSIGTTVEVVLHGANLENPKEIRLDDDCIVATDVAAGAKPGNEVKARFRIGLGCAPGEHVLRLRTATNLSEPVTFWVSPFPAVREIEKGQGENDTPQKAQIVPLNSTVEGEIARGQDADVDVYRVDMRAGERLSVEVEGMRLGTAAQGGVNDLMLRILNSDGQELAVSKDTALFVEDPVASIVTPAAGPYFIEIKQQIFTAPKLAFYRAHIGGFTRPLALFPAGGERGTSVDVRVLGDPTGDRVERVELPDTNGDSPYFSGAPGEKPPSPNRLRVSPYPNVMAAADGTSPASVLALPAALNGILDKNNSAQFRFSAKKGQAWRVQVFARSLGSPMDPIIRIRPANSDKNILIADDAILAELGYPSARGTWALPASLDPLAMFKPPADGDYILEIADTQGRTGPLFVYRIEIEPVHETILTYLSTTDGAPQPRVTGVAVPRGSRWTIDLQLAPGLGSEYKGDLIVEATGLPRGVEMIAQPVLKGQNHVPVQFYASDDADARIQFFDLTVQATDRKTPIESHPHQSVATMNRGIESAMHVVFLNHYAMAVTDPAPFHVEMEKPRAPLVQNGELTFKVHVVRSDGFKGPIVLAASWLPPNVSKGPAVTIAPDKTDGEFTIHAAAKALPGEYQVALNAWTQTSERIRISTEFVPVSIVEPYLKITLRRSSVEQGRAGQMKASVEVAKSFSGEAILGLKNLPKGVKLVDPKPKVTSSTREVVFDIEASTDALAGLYNGVTCDVSVTTNGETQHQQAGSGLLRVDPSRIAVVTK